MLEAQQYRCALTGWPLTPQTATVDHVIPLSRGGSNGIDNVQIIHWDVNKAKGVMMNDEFIAICKAVASHDQPVSNPQDRG